MTDSAPAGGYLSRHRGPVSLALAGGGLLACEAAIWAGWLPGAEGRVLATAFEGATVGGLADWFAVSALFHRIPLPGLSRHTDLLARKRERLAAEAAAARCAAVRAFCRALPKRTTHPGGKNKSAGCRSAACDLPIAFVSLILCLLWFIKTIGNTA